MAVIADSPTSVLKDEDISNVEMKQQISSDLEIGSIADAEDEKALPFELGAKNGDALLISESMAKVEEELSEARAKEKIEIKLDPDFKFNKLDQLLMQTQLYFEFLLEKMDDITMTNTTEVKDEVDGEDTSKEKRGRKRKATNCVTKYYTRRAKTAVAAMLTRYHEAIAPEDACLTEEERAIKEQAELVPLMTGGKLKNYQIKGVKWLISLWQNGLNGILADQMGLGKTVQTIGFLAHLKGKGLVGPYMVITPLSTLFNWVSEVQRFVPSMTAVIYHGTKSERMEIRRKFMPKSIVSEFPLIITSYEVVLKEAKALSHY